MEIWYECHRTGPINAFVLRLPIHALECKKTNAQEIIHVVSFPMSTDLKVLVCEDGTDEVSIVDFPGTRVNGLEKLINFVI